MQTWFEKHYKALLIELGLLFISAVIGLIASIIPHFPFPAWVNTAFLLLVAQAAETRVEAQAAKEALQLQGMVKPSTTTISTGTSSI